MKKLLPVLLLIFFLLLVGLFLFRLYLSAEREGHDIQTDTIASNEKEAHFKNIPADYILPSEEWGDYFEKQETQVAVWAKSVSMDNLPVSVTTFWSNVGGVDEKFFSSREVILYAFNSLAVLNLGEETGEATDNSIRICFAMADETVQSFDFNDGNAQIRTEGHQGCYHVSPQNGLEKIFSLAKDRNLTTIHSVTISEGAHLILDCPDMAHVGTKISLTARDVTDGEIIVNVNGTDLKKASESSNIFEFLMPDEDVTINLRVSTDGYTGS